ncbi:MAG TPA: SGNH/GDSL hydrolase family protein [Polyangiaceae bacterium]|nr:SGNH/GDSL hydrolase family protein [Polyangiaceae bacterium]
MRSPLAWWPLCLSACVPSASPRATAEDAGSRGASTPSASAPAHPEVPVTYSPCPPKGAPCRVLPLGDSITAIGGSYRAPLFRRARQAGQSLTFVGSQEAGPQDVDGAPFPRAHEGHPGYTIDPGGGRQGIAPLVPGAIAAYRPQIVTLMIGTNDVDTHLDLPNAPRRLAALVDAIESAAPDALLVLAQIVPTASAEEDADVVAYNAAMPALVDERARAGKHIVLVDMHGAFKKNPRYGAELLFDNLHPNDAGYAVMAEVWYAALAPVLR